MLFYVKFGFSLITTTLVMNINLSLGLYFVETTDLVQKEFIFCIIGWIKAFFLFISEVVTKSMQMGGEGSCGFKS